MNVLLVPTLRSLPASSPLPKHAASKPIASRSAAVSHVQPSSASPSPISEEWLGIPLKFVVERDSFEVTGFQMYAVEKWIVERRPITVLAVYSGNPQHKITVTSLVPAKDLSRTEAQEEWDKAIRHLQQQGTRPKEVAFVYPRTSGEEEKLQTGQESKGVVMVTFLPHFRSDHTIVPIPEGNFLAVREQLYTNINLLRMGCSGRTALTLEEPSDTTKDRFISTYQLPDSIELPSPNFPTSAENLPSSASISSTPNTSPRHKQKHSISKFMEPDHQFLDVPKTGSFSKSVGASPIISGSSIAASLSLSSRLSGKTKDRAAFNATVLELVKLLQAALFISGFYGSASTGRLQLDGLLCDTLVEGMQRWVADIGQSYLSLEPLERIANPTFISAILSTILAMRNRLSALGYHHLVPRDPFLHPYAFTLALSAFAYTKNPSHLPSANNSSLVVNNLAPSQYHPTIVASAFAMNPTASVALASPLLNSYSNSPPNQHYHVGTVLTRDLLLSIIASNEAKVRPGEGRRVRRALRDKLESAVIGSGAFDSEEENRVGHSPSVPFSPFGGSGVLAAGGDDMGSGSGQLLSGIGSLASGLGLGNNGIGGPLAGLMDGTVDLSAFLRMATSKEGITTRAGRSLGTVKDKVKSREKKESNEVYNPVTAHYGPGKDKDREGQFVGITVRALWGGRVWSVVKMRELEADRDRDMLSSNISADHKGSGDRERRWGRGVVSDGDGEGDLERLKSEKSDGRTTEEESDLTSPAGGLRAVHKKLWTGLNLSRRRGGGMSLDLSSPLMSKTAGSSMTKVSDLYPALNPTPVHSPTISNTPSRDYTSRYPEDEDIISSSQNSPVGRSHRPHISSLLNDFPLDDNVTTSGNKDLTEYERKLSVFQQVQQKHRPSRPNQPRISSWSDIISAQILEEARQDRFSANEEKQVFTGQTRDWAFPGVRPSKRYAVGDSQVPVSQSRRLFFGPKRRHSFHDFESFTGSYILNVDHMRVDVDLCGQLLVMLRRDEHLRSVVASVAILAQALSDSNTVLRENYLTHRDFLASLEERATAISQIHGENMQSNRISQATNTLDYEAKQFHVSDVWHAASPSRRKVLEYREKVFGMGGRRLPPGVYGAHKQYNRLQWRLDGKECLVDKLGRTESEADEESLADPEDRLDETSISEDEADVVQHASIKPMWLLRFLTRWGADPTAKNETKAGATSPTHKGATTEAAKNDDAAKSPSSGI